MYKQQKRAKIFEHELDANKHERKSFPHRRSGSMLLMQLHSKSVCMHVEDYKQQRKKKQQKTSNKLLP